MWRILGDEELNGFAEGLGMGVMVTAERMDAEEMITSKDGKVHDTEGDGQVLIKTMEAEVRFRRS